MTVRLFSNLGRKFHNSNNLLIHVDNSIQYCCAGKILHMIYVNKGVHHSKDGSFSFSEFNLNVCFIERYFDEFSSDLAEVIFFENEADNALDFCKSCIWYLSIVPISNRVSFAKLTSAARSSMTL